MQFEINEGLEEGEPEPQCPDGPNDFAGYELLCVLRTPGGRFTATKSYRPDPTGLRTAVKAADYNSGALFLCTLTFLENLEQFSSCFKSYRRILVRSLYAAC